MKSLIYGYGETGKSFERYLNKNNKKFEIFDNNLSNFNKEFNSQDFEKIFCSPGIPKDIYKKLSKENENIYTDLDIFFIEDNSIKIGITGTNRKSTTAYHLKQIFDNFEPSNLVGNIGNPMLDSINNNKKFSIIELSSFQLDKMRENKLDFGILLNIDIDHIDYHGSINSYHDAKKKILLAKNSISYETDPYKLFEWITNTKPKKIELNNLPYRYEIVAKNVINDSKSTNYHSLTYALKEAKNFFKDSNFALIVCGDPKKENFRKISLNEPEEVFIFGLHSKDIDMCLNHPKKTMMSSLSQILETIYRRRSNNNILFSPGYPSGKDFNNFTERGEHFNFLLKKYFS